ncbi:MAG TPA: LptA/OstA family protein [Patescibacteria group bacterium]|nr:LptA/OstA family protein [Patescibacteria group bacterium]
MLASGLLIAPYARAQNFTGKATVKPIKGFKIAEPYGPPNETQTKSFLEGETALPLPGGKTRLSDGGTLRTFTKTNTPQLFVKFQECIYDSARREVSSSGPIQMHTADGKFTIEGTGFFWRQTNSSLFISNNVHTMVQSIGVSPRAGTNAPAPGSANGPIYIDSVQFNYDEASGSGTWRDHVHLTGTNLVINSDMLRASGPVDQAKPPIRSLFAEKNVVVDYNGLHATGGRLAYSPDNGLIRLTEQAVWRADQRHGAGDELVVDRTNQIFQVNGHASLYLPGQAMGESSFLAYSGPAGLKTTNSPNRSIEILCDNYEVRTNLAAFREQVVLNEQFDNTNRGKMTCRNGMNVTFAGTNQLETLTALKDVVIEEGPKRFTGGRAFYTHTNMTLELTEKPEWEDRSRQARGKGDLLRLNNQKQEMLARGNASLTLPARELASAFSTNSTNVVARHAGTATNQFAEIFCAEYTLRPDNSVFLGGVYATHPEMVWSCEKLTLLVPAPGLTNVIAQQNVVFDVLTPKNKVHGTGDQAVYTFGVFNTVTNGMRPIDQLRLTGSPAEMSNTNITSRNPVIIWDRLKDKVSLPGSEYSIQGTGKDIGTNLFVLPKSKLTK